MREILFKAKRVDNGEWVEGYLYRISEEQKPFIMCINRHAESYEVDPSTICQYTGLTDKNGKKIWENNIIHIGDKAIPYIVEWHDTGFMGKAVNAMDRIGLKYWSPKIEVMGNIFDSPQKI